MNEAEIKQKEAKVEELSKNGARLEQEWSKIWVKFKQLRKQEWSKSGARVEQGWSESRTIVE